MHAEPRQRISPLPAFLQLQHLGVVQTAAFTLEVPVKTGVDTGHSSQ
jgi:hypothetical protein